MRGGAKAFFTIKQFNRNARAPVEIDIGSKLLRLRKEQGLPLRALSKASGISANAISLIERNKISPTISTLTKLIVTLKSNLTFFFEEKKTRDVVYRKRNTNDQMTSRNSKVRLVSLGSGLPNQKIEPVLATFDEGATSGSKSLTHQGNELVYCLEGKIKFEIEEQQYLLEPGDSIFFNGTRPHRWTNVSKGKSKVLAVMATKHWLRKDIAAR